MFKPENLLIVIILIIFITLIIVLIIINIYELENYPIWSWSSLSLLFFCLSLFRDLWSGFSVFCCSWSFLALCFLLLSICFLNDLHVPFVGASSFSSSCVSCSLHLFFHLFLHFSHLLLWNFTFEESNFSSNLLLVVLVEILVNLVLLFDLLIQWQIFFQQSVCDVKIHILLYLSDQPCFNWLLHHFPMQLFMIISSKISFFLSLSFSVYSSHFSIIMINKVVFHFFFFSLKSFSFFFSSSDFVIIFLTNSGLYLVLIHVYINDKQF